MFLYAEPTWYTGDPGWRGGTGEALGPWLPRCLQRQQKLQPRSETGAVASSRTSPLGPGPAAPGDAAVSQLMCQVSGPWCGSWSQSFLLESVCISCAGPSELWEAVPAVVLALYWGPCSPSFWLRYGAGHLELGRLGDLPGVSELISQSLWAVLTLTHWRRPRLLPASLLR